MRADKATGNEKPIFATPVSGIGTGDDPDTIKSCHYKTAPTVDVDADGVYTRISSPIPPPRHTCLSTEYGHAHTV